jgi:CHAT domain-containing protein
LIEHFPIVYLPSPALAEDILNQSKPLTKEALLLGNPTGDLKQAEAEVREIAKQLKRKGFQSPDPPVTGSQATTHCVYTQAPSAAFIHFACHSFLEPTDFLRSGVELVDRRLTALDVSATLELKNAALVFLNSCDSGQALPGHTDELVALTRVFLYAGSPTILATLWALDDRVGRTFAEYFYKFWIDKEQPLAVAFQKAMRKTRVLYDHPFDWAPFVLMGAWQAGYFHEH